MKLHLPRHGLLLSFGLTILLSAFLTSCKSTQGQDGAQYATNGQYATSPSDGHYNPYPSGGTPPATSSTQSQYQQYTEAPAPPSQPKKSSTSTASTKKKKSTTSSSSNSKTASTTKKKSTDKTTSKTADKSTSKTTSAASGTTYAVKQGDTLYGIAHKNHVTISKLKSTNNLTSDSIHPGMKLKIP